jgi:cytochrome c oxidase subunit II
MLNEFGGIYPNASEHGYLIDNMLEFCHWFMLSLFVGWSAFFAFTLFRFHKSRHPKANYHGVKSHFSSHIEFSVVLIEAVILLGFGLPLWGRRVNDFPKPEENPLTIRVVAQQFMWNFHYSGPDGKFGRANKDFVNSSNSLGLDRNDPAAKDDIVSPGEMHIPVNRKVILEITSKDVIHSFSFQAMRIGQDAIPGMKIPIWFKPVKTGEYELICGQLCGSNHYNMRAVVKVDTQEEYDSWIKEMEQINGQ